jgi:hypothetical protein
MHFAIIPTAFAQTNNADPCTSLGSFSILCNLTANDFGLVVSTGLNIILIFAIILAVIYFMYGGIRWVLSRGDKEKIEAARNHITASVVGLAISFLAFFIINISVGFFIPGKSIKDLSLPTLGPDRIPPAISVISPISDSTVSESTAIQANATDNKQVTKVEFYIDGTLKNTDTTEPFLYNWDTQSYKHNSAHTILAKAYDSAGNVGVSKAINVVVIDVVKPTVNITYPANNEKISSGSSVTISASVHDISSIAQVEFRVNGALKCTDYDASYICAWQVPGIKGVIYRIEVSAVDTAGNIGKSSNSATAM